MIEIPTNLEDNKKVRLNVLSKAEKDPELQAMLIRKCKEDPIFFCNLFCWTYDPRLNEPHLPFILYPRQAELFKELDRYLELSYKGERINLIIDKPRAVGASFTVMVWLLQKFLFTEFTARVGSRKEDYVDKKGDSDTLFYKIDYNLDRIPNWLKMGYRPINDRASMIIKHPNGVNALSGESANPNFGRGGRKSVIVFDEIGFWETSESSWSSSGESTNFRIAMTTPPETGRDSFFYKLLSGRKGKIHRFDFDWKDVPNRDDKWLEMMRETKSEEEFAREVMKSYDGSTEGKVYANDMRFVKLSDVKYNPRLPLFVSWDDGRDATALIWWQKDFSTNQLYIIDCYQESGRGVEYFVPFFGHDIPSIISPIDGSHSTPEYNSYAKEKIELHKTWRRDTIHYGDPSIKQKKNNVGEMGMSGFDILMEKYGIVVNSKNWAGRNWLDVREITRPVFRRLEINEKKCEMLIYALRNARYPAIKEGSQATTVPLKPIHDLSTSHFRSSFEYFCDSEPKSFFEEEQEEIEEDFNKFSVF